MSMYDYSDPTLLSAVPQKNEDLLENEEENKTRLDFLKECAFNADQLLVDIGMEPCAENWTKPSYKDERDRIMRRLVELRDQSEDLTKKTGEARFP